MLDALVTIGIYWFLYKCVEAYVLWRERPKVRTLSIALNERYTQLMSFVNPLRKLRELHDRKEVVHLYGDGSSCSITGHSSPSTAEQSFRKCGVPLGILAPTDWVIPPKVHITVKGRLIVKNDVIVLGCLTCDTIHFIPYWKVGKWCLPRVYASNFEGEGGMRNEEHHQELVREEYRNRENAHLSFLSHRRREEEYNKLGLPIPDEEEEIVILTGRKRYPDNPFIKNLTFGCPERRGAEACEGDVEQKGDDDFDWEVHDPVTCSETDLADQIKMMEKQLGIRSEGEWDVTVDSSDEEEETEGSKI